MLKQRDQAELSKIDWTARKFLDAAEDVPVEVVPIDSRLSPHFGVKLLISYKPAVQLAAV